LHGGPSLKTYLDDRARREESHLKTEVTKGEGHQVTLKVEAGPEDMQDILEQTYKDLSSKVKVSGFRKGKVPRQVIDSHLGPEYVRTEAVKNGMPTLYVLGVVDAGILPVSDPEIDILDLSEDGGVTFEARVDVKPEIEVKDYRGLEVDRPDTEVTEEDVQNTLDEARDRFATLEVVDGRPVAEGDFVMFDYKVFTDGVPLEGSSGSDRMTEVGTGDFLPDFDKQLVGSRKGDIIDVVIDFPPEYEDRALAGKPATFRTIVKEIKHKVLPELNDDLAKEISNFETLQEFTEDMRARIATVKETMGERAIREQVVKTLADKTYIDLPESMIERQINEEIEGMSKELEERGITLDEYMEAMKGTRYQLEKAIRERVVEGLKAELAVDAVASAEDIEVSDDEAEQYIRESALRSGADPDKVLEETRGQAGMLSIKANLRISKAIDLLVENSAFKGGGKVTDEFAGAIAVKKPPEAETAEPREAEDNQVSEEPQADTDQDELIAGAEAEVVDEEGQEPK
jgi:trigger factor